jgi:S1-C subfamily serine protease
MEQVIKSQYDTVVSLQCNFPGVTQSGTGVLIKKDGYIATNFHVVSRRDGNGNLVFASSVTVTHWTRWHYDGTYVEKDMDEASYTLSFASSLLYPTTRNATSSEVLTAEKQDLVILKSSRTANADPGFDFSDVAAVFRSPDRPLVVGEPVVALGNSFGTGQLFRASVGVVSQTMSTFSALMEDGGQKVFKNAIFHDATIIGGNSGGPLFDRDGRLLGLNTLVFMTSPTNGQMDEQVPAFGFSVAISSTVILEAMQQIGIA